MHFKKVVYIFTIRTSKDLPTMPRTSQDKHDLCWKTVYWLILCRQIIQRDRKTWESFRRKKEREELDKRKHQKKRVCENTWSWKLILCHNLMIIQIIAWIFPIIYFITNYITFIDSLTELRVYLRWKSLHNPKNLYLFMTRRLSYHGGKL